MSDLLRGAMAGVAATAAMTVVQLTGTCLAKANSPQPERDAPPEEWVPRQVLEGTLERAGVDTDRLSPEAITAWSVPAHFAYGAMWGGLYSIAVGEREAGVPTGVAFGLLVWSLNYAGMLPAADILPPPQRETPNYNVRALLAHVVFGGTLALALSRMKAK